MGVIKSNLAPASLVPFSMKDVEQQARAMLLRAKQQAEQLLAAAQHEANGMREAARQEGHQKGWEQGMAEGLKQGAEVGEQKALEQESQRLSEAVAMLFTLLGTLEASRNDLEVHGLREVISLAASIARRVTKRQGMIDEQVLAANLTESMKLAVQCSDVRIAVHSSQRQTLEKALPKLQLQWPALAHVQWINDDSLAPGGCRVYTVGGQVDGDLDGQLDRVIDELLPKTAESIA